MKLRLILYMFLCMVFLSGCGTSKHGYQGQRSLTIFQTLENGRYGSTALAKDKEWNVFYVISIRTHIYENEMFYDDKDITGYYYVIGTYAYETKSGSIKTVRTIIRRENYNSMDPQEKIHFRYLCRAKLSYYYEFNEEEKK